MSKKAFKGVRCAECDGRNALPLGGAAIYPHRPDLFGKTFWRCPCGAYVGCHPGTTNALGSCAGPATRQARSAAHAAFDPLWKAGGMSRKQAYAALAAAMGMPAGKCHISWMSRAEALLVPEAVDKLRAAL